MRTETCATCKYKGATTHADFDEPEYATCRKAAPDPAIGYYGWVHIRPAEDWCGDYKPAPEEGTPV